MRLVTDRASLVWLDAGQSRVFPAERGLPSSSVSLVLEDAQQGLWVSYNNGEVCRIKAGQLKVFSEADGLPEGPLCCSLAMDTKGRLWFLKNGRLGFFREEAFQTMAKVPPGPGRLTPSRKGGVWFSSGGRLFYCDESGTVQSQGECAPGRDAATTASVLLEAQDGAVWVGTAFHGLYRFAEQQFEQVPTTHREILSLLEDVEGTIWAGTGGGGLNRIRPQAIELLTGEPGSPLDSVSSIAQETNGVVWAVTRDGSLSRLKGGRWQALPRSTNWFADALSVAVDALGAVWVGTRHHGLLFWQDEQFVPWGDTSQIKTDSIHTIVPGRNGDIWLGGGEIPAAVMRLRGGKILNFRVPNDVRVIRASVEDAAGNIWFGTSKGFLLRAEGERLIDETPRTTGEPQSIRCLYATPDGGLWIGYAGAGLGWLKDNKFTLFTAKQGLQDDFVSQIVADGRGWLWLGADRGIYRVRQAELEAVAQGKAARFHSTHYGPGYGLPSLQANFGSAPLGLRSPDGRIWLAMWTALAVIDPQRLPETTPSPPVLLTRMMVGERIVAAYGGVWPLSTGGPEVLDLSRPLDREVKLAPDHRRLEFGFAALNFADAENVSFRYRLEGVDEDWVDTERRNVTYPRLPKGHYRFRVSACSPEGAWSDKEASVMFQVEPFFWETWWFRLLVPTLFTAFVIALVRYVSFRRLRSQVIHLEQQSALYKERARIAQDIHDDLGASLTQISFMGELARQDSATPEKVTVHIETMAGTARRAVKALDEIVWAVNPRNDTLVQFIDYTAQFSLDYLRRAGVRCRLDLPEQVPDGQLSSDIRHNLFLVVKEAINNTVKYAHATELRLRIALDESKLELLIEDNGCGFAQVKDDTNADGLRNIRKRVADLGGKCRIEGDPGQGTRIAVELPRPRDVKR
ncbi:MAG: triple tyrosine motif-containing protein [Verrucomicrobiota bacterium]